MYFLFLSAAYSVFWEALHITSCPVERLQLWWYESDELKNTNIEKSFKQRIYALVLQCFHSVASLSFAAIDLPCSQMLTRRCLIRSSTSLLQEHTHSSSSSFFFSSSPLLLFSSSHRLKSRESDLGNKWFWWTWQSIEEPSSVRPEVFPGLIWFM